jgi:hypothetical protein
MKAQQLIMVNCFSCEDRWRVRQLATPIVDSECCLVDVEEARLFFRDKHVLFVGDSVTRYFYLVFTYWLQYDTFPPHVRDGMLPALVEEKTFPSWQTFFEITSGLFERETCDCFRPETGKFELTTVDASQSSMH